MTTASATYEQTFKPIIDWVVFGIVVFVLVGGSMKLGELSGFLWSLF